MLTGELAPDAGTVRLGTNLEIATLDQKRAAVDPQETLAQYLTDGRGETVVVNGEERHVVSYMKDFLFKAEQARTPVRELSGGERARLILARVLARPANLLVLDEPTNDLDMETLELLQELVAGFAGTVILVSHDRDFLDRTVTSIIAPDSGGRWIEYAGGYSDMLAQRGGTKLEDRKSAAKLASAAAQSKPAGAPKAAAKKLSFKQKFALENLPKKMAAVSASISSLENQLADPAFYERSPASFAKTIAALDKERQTLAALEEEWLELEMLREELEG
jgi:ATP-binding cassette subfamily F protein uup